MGQKAVFRATLITALLVPGLTILYYIQYSSKYMAVQLLLRQASHHRLAQSLFHGIMGGGPQQYSGLSTYKNTRLKTNKKNS